MKTYRKKKKTCKLLSSIETQFGVALLSRQRTRQNEKVLNLAVTSVAFQAAFLRKEHFDEHFQANLRFKRTNPLNKKICKQKIVNFKPKLNGTENIHFSFVINQLKNKNAYH